MKNKLITIAIFTLMAISFVSAGWFGFDTGSNDREKIGLDILYNSSDFWDSLDDPSDILGSQIVNDLGWVNSSTSTCEVDQSCDNILYESDLPLENRTLSYCGNITGATSDLCTIVDTDTNRSDADILGVCTVYNDTAWVLAQSYLTSESDPIYSAWDKDYDDLTNKPSIPTIWDAVFNNTGDSRWFGIWDYDYNDLINKPSIPTIWDATFNNTGDSRWLDGGSDGNASSICSGTTTYLDGEGNCDDISSVYFDDESDITCTDISGLSADLCDNGDADTQLSQEQVQDYAGAMAGTHLTYTDGSNDLSVDDDWVDIDGDTMTGNLNMNTYNVTNVDFITICNGANCWKLYVNASDYFIIEEI